MTQTSHVFLSQNAKEQRSEGTVQAARAGVDAEGMRPKLGSGCVECMDTPHVTRHTGSAPSLARQVEPRPVACRTTTWLLGHTAVPFQKNSSTSGNPPVAASQVAGMTGDRVCAGDSPGRTSNMSCTVRSLFLTCLLRLFCGRFTLYCSICDSVCVHRGQ